MRISQKLDYANRAIMQLAKCYDGKSVCKLDEISQKEAIPASFLVQILTELKKAGILKSKRGKSGGYILSQSPSMITLADVIEAVEPQLLEPAHQMEGESHTELSQAWGQISQCFEQKAREITFEDLLIKKEEPMWFF